MATASTSPASAARICGSASSRRATRTDSGSSVPRGTSGRRMPSDMVENYYRERATNATPHHALYAARRQRRPSSARNAIARSSLLRWLRRYFLPLLPGAERLAREDRLVGEAKLFSEPVEVACNRHFAALFADFVGGHHRRARRGVADLRVPDHDVT